MEFEIFRFGGIPVRLSIWALLLVGWFALRSDPISGVFLALGVLTSVLIHEYGHALVARHYKLSPSIRLHALGGATAHAPAQTDGQDALILVAGATLQLIASAVFAAIWFALGAFAPAVAVHPYLASFGSAFLFVGVFWAVVNLLPLWPLDGGKLYRLGLLRLLNVKPAMADKVTHWTAIVGMALLILAFWLLFAGGGGVFIVLLLFGFLIFQNVQALRAGASAGPIRRVNTHAKSLLANARKAFQQRNWAEAARIGHQIRHEPEISDRMLDEVFEIIALAHIMDGKLEEGVRFARRAPATPKVIEAQVKAQLHLGRTEDARRTLMDRGAQLSFELQRELRAEIDKHTVN